MRPALSTTMAPTHLIVDWSSPVTTRSVTKSGALKPPLAQGGTKTPERRRGAVKTFLNEYEPGQDGRVNVNVKKLLTWAAVALVLFFLISAPTQASGLVTHILDLLKNAATAIVAFVKTLFG